MRTYIVLHLLLFPSGPVVPANAGDRRPAAGPAEDTTAVFRIDTITVSADRYPRSAHESGAVVYEIPAGPLVLPPDGPAGALAGVRNLHLTPYGGGPGLRTVSIRGMASEHTLFLWNGLPAPALQNGIVDLGSLPGVDLEGLRVVPGSSSSLHGSGAVGGTVNIVPAAPSASAAEFTLGGGVGSYGATVATAGAAGPLLPGIRVSATAGRSRGRGDYPVPRTGDGGAASRSNGDHRKESFTAAAAADLDAGGRVDLLLSVLDLEQGSPGSTAAPSTDARRRDRRYLALAGVQTAPGEEGWSLAAMLDVQLQRYRDPGALRPIDNHYRSLWFGAAGRYRRVLREGLDVMAGLEGGYGRSSGNAVEGGAAGRRTGALSAAASWSAVETGAVRATLTPSLRLETASDGAPAATPHAGVNVEIAQAAAIVRIHAAAGGGRRNPTMNERYYSGEGGIGNPSIRPESAFGLEAGAGVSLRTPIGGFSVDLTRYRIVMDDRIQWVPTENPRIWSPRNLLATRSSGWEFGAVWETPVPGLRLDVDYSTIDSKRGTATAEGATRYSEQLVYIPLDKGSAGLRWSIAGAREGAPRAEAEIRWIRTGVRYVLDDNSESLPAHDVGEAGIRLSSGVPGGRAVLRYLVRNVSSAAYQVIPGYPMPGREHLATFTYTLTPWEVP